MLFKISDQICDVCNFATWIDKLTARIRIVMESLRAVAGSPQNEVAVEIQAINVDRLQ
jgi:hypothetical protein